MSFMNLEIWKMASDLVVDIHSMSLSLPKIELYEEGAQIRKSIKNVKSTIAEGYGRRKYKSDFIKFLIYAQASTDETIDHLDTLYKTKSLTDENKFLSTKQSLENLGKKINQFIKGVERTPWK